MESGQPVTIEEENISSGGEIQTVLSSISDSVFEEFDTGFPPNGGSDGNVGGDAGLREELEMHGIELNHDMLGCRTYSLQGNCIYCPQSRHHPDHPVHVCPWVGVCGCLSLD